MSFELKDDVADSHKMIVPVNGTDTVYAGSLVYWNGEGVTAIGAASGAGSTTTEKPIAGLVLGTNNETKVNHAGGTISGFSGEEITGLATQATLLARTQLGNRGMFIKGEKTAMVEIALLNSSSRLKGILRDGGATTPYQTGPTVQTVTTTSADGATATSTTAATVATVAHQSTVFVRRGANKDLYRVTSSASTTAFTLDVPFTFDLTAGATPTEQFVVVNAKIGLCRAQIDATGLYIDINAAVTADYYDIVVESLDLRVANEETVTFRFTSAMFDARSTA